MQQERKNIVSSKNKLNNSNDMREAMNRVIEDLLSGKASNLEAVSLAVKALAVRVQEHRNHLHECRINGKTSRKQNAGWAKYASQPATAELEAKAKAKADKVSAELSKSKRQAAYRKRKKSKIESPSVVKIAKRGPGRPKGSKSKAPSVVVAKRGPGRPKGSKNKARTLKKAA